MMKVCYSEMDTPAGLSCRLEADGHAGYAPAGQDIVCAGASTVMQGLVYLLAGEENAHSEAFDEPDGPRLAVSVDAPCEEWVRGAFELAKACFVLLAERYPENVRFADVSRRGKESMMDLQLFAAETTAACGGNREPRLGQRSDFSKPCQGAAEKSANATRCCCLARGRISTISANKKHRLRLVLFCISNRISPSFKKYVSIIFAQNLLKRIRKPDILLLRPLWAPLGVLSGTKEFFVLIAPQHEGVHIVGCVFQTVLI